MNGGALSGLDVSRETMDDLEAYVDLLSKWNRSINLVSQKSLSDVWTRHIQDSAQLWQYKPDVLERWVDIGSGGGLPAIVIAILSKGKEAGFETVLVESDQRKCTFLRTVTRELALNCTIVEKRVEDAEPLRGDVVSARALAPIADLLGMGLRHRADEGCFLFLKGQSHKEELTQASKDWHMTVETFPSQTDSQAAIVKIGALTRAR